MTLRGERNLITGATGKVAFPIARALAADNDVWGAARLRDPVDRDKLSAAGITPIAPDMTFCSTGSVYGYQGRRPLRPNYSFSKIAAESVCTWPRCTGATASAG